MFKRWVVLSMIILTSLIPRTVLTALNNDLPPKVINSDFNFSGSWTVRWLSNDSLNPMTLNQDAFKFSGHYVNDLQDNCSVSGELEPSSQFIKFLVKCPKWDIQMEGFSTLDGRTIVGEYFAYGKAAGGFIMSKK